MYKKTLLNSAIALALATSSGAALAVVDIDSNSGQPTYANEPLETTNFIPKPDGWVNGLMNNIDVTGQLGWSVGAAGAPRFMRFDFFNAELEGGFSAADLTLSPLSGATYSVSISAGGADGDTFVVFEVTNTDTGNLNIDNTDDFDLRIAEVIGNKTGAQVRYRAFETGLIAQNALPDDPVDPNETFKDITADWFNWAVGKTVSCNFVPGQDGLIDTIERAFWEGQPFVPGAEVKIADATATALGGILNPTTDAQVDFDDYYAQGNASFFLEGDFQGIASVRLLDDGTPNSLADVSFPPNTPPSPNPQNAGGPYTGFNAFGYSNASVFLTNTIDRDGDPGADEMIPSEYQIRFTQPIPISNNADFRVPDEIAPCGETLASGSSDRLDYTAAPAGSGPNRSLLRIVNPSDRGGEVVMRVINDDGMSTPFFPIEEVDGIDSSELAAGASTAVVDIERVRELAETTYGLGQPGGTPARNKLRIEVRARFGQDAYDGNFRFDLPGTSGNPAPGPSGQGLIQVRGQQLQGRASDGVQIQGYMFNAEGTVIPYNER